MAWFISLKWLAVLYKCFQCKYKSRRFLNLRDFFVRNRVQSIVVKPI